MVEKTEAEILQDSRVISALCEKLDADLVSFEQRQSDGSVVDAVFRSRTSGGLIAVEAKKLLSKELIGQVVSVCISGLFETCVALVTHTERGKDGSKFDVRFRRDTCPIRALKVANAIGFKLLCVKNDMSIATIGEEEPLAVLRRNVTPSDKMTRRNAKRDHPQKYILRDGALGGRNAMRMEHLKILRIAEERGYVTIYDIPDNLISHNKMERQRRRAEANPKIKTPPTSKYLINSAKTCYMQQRFVQHDVTANGGYLRRDYSIRLGGVLAAYVLTDVGRNALEKRVHIVI